MKRKQKNNTPPIKVGDYIRKKNYTSVFGKNLPVIKIKHINQKNGTVNNIPNSTLHKPANLNSLVVISEEEAIQLMEEWNNTYVSPIPSTNRNYVHVREDNNQPKEPINAFHIKEVLFRYRKTVSEDMDAYKCPVCGYYHLGKNKHNLN
ncbi:MAG: hypothetical protein ACOCVF_01310 [bacterium]